MLIKIYADSISSSTEAFTSEHEQLHIIENAQDVVVHQGNWCAPEWLGIPSTPTMMWGPEPSYLPVENFGSTSKDTTRVVDYTHNGERKRALVKLLAYVCNDNGKTIERVEIYSGAKLSKL